MSGNTDIREELAVLRVIGGNLRETLGRMARKLAGTPALSVSLTVDLSNTLLGHIERCEPPIRASRVKSRPPEHVESATGGLPATGGRQEQELILREGLL
jgi:hypothetical protein